IGDAAVRVLDERELNAELDRLGGHGDDGVMRAGVDGDELYPLVAIPAFEAIEDRQIFLCERTIGIDEDEDERFLVAEVRERPREVADVLEAGVIDRCADLDLAVGGRGDGDAEHECYEEESRAHGENSGVASQSSSGSAGRRPRCALASAVPAPRTSTHYHMATGRICPMPDTPVTNFGGNTTFRPAGRYAPRSESELLDILRRHRGRRIRAIGRLHSWSDVTVCEDVLLDLRHLDSVVVHAD